MSFTPIPDPFPAKNATIPPGSADFYERMDEFTRVLTLLRGGESVSLVGERKAGKTSFLNYLLAHLPRDEFIPVFVDGQHIAPKTDKLFLGHLARNAARAVEEIYGIDRGAIEIRTLQVEAGSDEVYMAFHDDLATLCQHLSAVANPQNRKLVWLIDEIDVLRGFEHTNLFSFLRPLAQSDEDFRLVVAGYDVLYTLAEKSECTPFFNAFQSTRLKGLNPAVARQLVDDALTRMDVEMDVDVDQRVYQTVLEWSGQKPFFLKWFMSKVADVLNQQQGRSMSHDIVQTAQDLFLAEPELRYHFAHLWDSYTTGLQRTVLSLMSSDAATYNNHPVILTRFIEKKLIQSGQQASQQLMQDLARLEQLGFLYEHIGSYTFTSGCLEAWIRVHKPLEQLNGNLCPESQK